MVASLRALKAGGPANVCMAPDLSGSLCSADTVIGRARWPRLSDRPQLPYLEAFILETFRHSSFVPFTIPHR